MIEIVAASKYVFDSDFTERMEPEDVFPKFMRQNWVWEVRYHSATPEEKEKWLWSDIFYRIRRAFLDRRPVFFGGKRYGRKVENDPKKDLEMIKEYAKEITAEIFSSSPRVIEIMSDDEKGLEIVAL
jgi:hypothetical protein